MSRDGCPIAHPNTVVPLNVVQQPLQRADSARTADDSPVQTDTHHPGATLPTAPIEPIECIRAVTEKVLAGRDIATALHPTVVAVKRVGNDELMACANRCPVRQIVVVRITVVQKPAELGGQPAGVRARTACIPHYGPLTA